MSARPDPKVAWETLVRRAEARMGRQSDRVRLAREKAAALALLCLRAGARRVILFGSLVTGDIRRGDIDLAVEGLPADAFFPLLGELLEEAVPFPLDLVRVEEAPPLLRERILTEGEVLLDRG